MIYFLALFKFKTFVISKKEVDVFEIFNKFNCRGCFIKLSEGHGDSTFQITREKTKHDIYAFRYKQKAN